MVTTNWDEYDSCLFKIPDFIFVPLSPQHGKSLYYEWRRQPTRGGFPAGGLGIWLTASYRK
jgi:hypothetical protein